MNASGSARPAGRNLRESERLKVRNHHLLGVIPDTKLGEMLGVSKFTIARARKARGIPPFRAVKPEPVNEISELIRGWRR